MQCDVGNQTELHRWRELLRVLLGLIRPASDADSIYQNLKMHQPCGVCGEPAAGYHFGAFTCEGCKSFFGRTYNNTSTILECRNGGRCEINKKTRTSCKACRLRKCHEVGMSKLCSRYGRRSNWFKIQYSINEPYLRYHIRNNDMGTAIMPGPSSMSLSRPARRQQQRQASNEADWNLPSTSRDSLNLNGHPVHLVFPQAYQSSSLNRSSSPNLDNASLCSRLSSASESQRAEEAAETAAQSQLSAITPPPTPHDDKSPITATPSTIQADCQAEMPSHSSGSSGSFSEYRRDSRVGRHRHFGRSDSSDFSDESDYYYDCESESNRNRTFSAFNRQVSEQELMMLRVSANVPIQAIPIQGVPSSQPTVFSSPGMITPEVHSEISPREGECLRLSPNSDIHANEQPIDLSIRARVSDARRTLKNLDVSMDVKEQAEGGEQGDEPAEEATTIPLDLSQSGFDSSRLDRDSRST